MTDLRETLDMYRNLPPVDSSKKRSGNYPSAASIKFIDPKTGLELVKGSCLRQQYYSRKGFPVTGTIDARIDRIRDMGNLISEMFVDDSKKAGIYLADEISFYDEENNISGRIDLIVKDPLACPETLKRPTPEQIAVIEIKSIGGYYNVKGPIKATRDTPLRPKVEHLMQLMIYANHYMKWGVAKFVLLYVNRENLEYQIHNVSINEHGQPVVVNNSGIETWTHITMKGILDRYKELSVYLTADELPPRDYTQQWDNPRIMKEYHAGNFGKTDGAVIERAVKSNSHENEAPILNKGDWECRYCDFADLCWSDNPETKVIETDEPVEFKMEDILSVDEV